MQILVLDTIHGGAVIGDALRGMGHEVDLVDVYRGDLSHQGSITDATAQSRRYDLLVHPVHLDPAHPLLRWFTCPSINHHEAVRWILGPPQGSRFSGKGLCIEITGARGKTTTATALASVMGGSGILHTSRGTFRYPGEEFITRLSIAPGSIIPAYSFLSDSQWFIAEVSLGFTGLSDLAVLTSYEDYRVAAGRLSAREIKELSGLSCRRILVPPGMAYAHDNVTDSGDITRISGTVCSYSYEGISGSFENQLFSLEGYRNPLLMAAAAALMCGCRPDDLGKFSPIPGRMKITSEDGKMIVDNASTGACLKTTRDAICLVQTPGADTPYTLVIGQEARAVCENFPDDDIMTVIREGTPFAVVLVAGDERMNVHSITEQCQEKAIPISVVSSLHEGVSIARNLPAHTIVVSVKTWR